MTTIHQRIKDARVAKALSMEGLAKLVGVKWQAVQKWENGEAAPKRTRLAKVAKELSTTTEYLMSGLVETPPALNEPRSSDYTKNVVSIPKQDSREVREILSLIDAMDEKGHVMLLAHARNAAKEYPKVKANSGN